MTIYANVHEAKPRISELLERAHKGEEVLIAKAGKPYARLVPLATARTREAGALRGRISGEANFARPGGSRPSSSKLRMR